MEFNKFLSLFDKQWHAHPDNKKDKSSQYYNVNKDITIAYFFDHNSMWLEYDVPKSQGMNRLVYSPKDNIINYDSWKRYSYKTVDDISWKFPLCSTEEEFFMNTTIYDGGKYCTLDDLIKIKSFYNKIDNIIKWGKNS